MKMMNVEVLYRTILVGSVLMVGSVSAQESSMTSQEPVSKESTQAVEISATKDPELKRYKYMLKGMDAFEKYHALAPLSQLKFKLKVLTPTIQYSDIKLKIASDNLNIPVNIDESGYFTLPRNEAALDQDADLVSNYKKKSILWKVEIRTPNLAENIYRLGDFRLKCEVSWAIDYDEAPFILRNAFRLVGGPCNSSKIGASFEFPDMKSAFLVEGERRLEIKVVNTKYLFLPLYDKSWGNDTLIELELISPKAD